MEASPRTGQAKRLALGDLVAAGAAAGYPIKQRLITDWASIGLLDHPQAKGRGRGKGKDYTWPPEQAGLLVTILRKREAGIGRTTLMNVPVITWLVWGDRFVPVRQARRALYTWSRSTLRVGPEKVGRSLKATLDQLDHPAATPADRRELRELLERIAFGQAYDRDELVSRVRQVMDPHGTGLIRGLPEGAPLTPELYAETLDARLRGARHAERDDLDDDVWYQARHVYLTSGPLAPYIDQLMNPSPTGRLSAAARTQVDYATTGACLHLIQLLGHLSRQPDEASTS